jgi:hypothetical protein
MKEVIAMKIWKPLVLILLAIGLTLFLITRTDEYQIGKIVMTHAKKFARENTVHLAGCKIHLLKDGVAIFFGETTGDDDEKKGPFKESSLQVRNSREMAQGSPLSFHVL